MERMTLNEYAASVQNPFPTAGIWTQFPQSDGISWESLFLQRYGHRRLFCTDPQLFRSTLRFRASVALPYYKDKLGVLSWQLSALKADETETTSTLYSPPDGVGSLASEYVAGKNVVKVKGASSGNTGNMAFVQDAFRSVYMEALDSFANLFYSVLNGGGCDDD